MPATIYSVITTGVADSSMLVDGTGFGGTQNSSTLLVFDPSAGAFFSVSIDTWGDDEIVATVPYLSHPTVTGVYCVVLLEGEEQAAKSSEFSVYWPYADWSFDPTHPALPESMCIATNIGGSGSYGPIPTDPLCGVPSGVINGRNLIVDDVAYNAQTSSGGNHYNLIPGSTSYGTTLRIYQAGLLGTLAWRKMGAFSEAYWG
jgi:hypothetical protein